jgi:hypothetical protein
VTAPAIPALPGPALLFCPADRPDRYAKALAAADVIVLTPLTQSSSPWSTRLMLDASPDGDMASRG